jgi:hypothetical protein
VGVKSGLLLPIALLSVTLVGCSGRLSSFDPGVAGDGELEGALERIRGEHGLPALAGVLVRHGELVETGAVGVRASGLVEPVTTGDRWHLGSIGKSMTATVAAVLVEDGVIEWTTTIAEVFPDFAGSTRRNQLTLVVHLEAALQNQEQSAGVLALTDEVVSLQAVYDETSFQQLRDLVFAHRLEYFRACVASPEEVVRLGPCLFVRRSGGAVHLRISANDFRDLTGQIRARWCALKNRQERRADATEMLDIRGDEYEWHEQSCNWMAHERLVGLEADR